MDFSMKRVVCGAIWGHVAGIGVLVLLSCVAMMLSYPCESVMLVGILAMMLGSAFVGFWQRGQGASIAQAALSGALYAVVLLVASFFGKGEQLSWGYRLILALAAVLLSALPTWLFRKKKTRRRRARR